MALNISPGPLNAQDGDRIRPDPVIIDFVKGTDITNFGLQELGTNIGITIAQTEAPADPARNTLWFRRGEGRLYKFDIIPNFSPTEGRWVAISDRRDTLVHYNSSVETGDVLVRDSSITNMSFVGRFNRHLMLVMTTPVGDATIPNGDHMPPYLVAQTEGSRGDVQVVTEMGYSDVNACSATGPSYGCLERGMSDTKRLVVKDNPYPTPSTRTMVGFIVESAATVATRSFKTFHNCLGTQLVS